MNNLTDRVEVAVVPEVVRRRHELLADNGLVADRCDVEAAANIYRWRVETGNWPRFELPPSLRVAA